MLNNSQYNENWKLWVVAWLMGVAVVGLATPLGFLTVLTGTAGLYFIYHGIRAVERAVSSTSVERGTIGSLDGRREAVQIVGSAKPVDEPFVAPMTGTDCVAWDLRVTENTPMREESE